MPETPYNAQTYLTTPTCTATSARESTAQSARIAQWQRSARESAAKSARIAPWQRSARECGIFSRLEWKNVAACAGKRCPICPKSSVATFCAGMGYLFPPGKENCSSLRGNPLPNPPGLLRGNILRGNGVSFPPGMEKCSRLRGNPLPNPPGMLRST